MNPPRRTGRPHTLAEELLIMLYDRDTGRRLISSAEVDLLVGGAVLAELAERRRILLTDPRPVTKNRTVVIVDPAPTGDDVLDQALQRIAARRPTRSQVAVSRISKEVRGRLLERLAGSGLLRFERSRVAGIFPASAWHATDSRHIEELLDGLEAALAGERPPTRREATTISLLHAIKRVAHVLGTAGLDRHALNRRAKAIAEGEAIGEAVRRARDAAAF